MALTINLDQRLHLGRDCDTFDNMSILLESQIFYPESIVSQYTNLALDSQIANFSQLALYAKKLHMPF